MVNNTIHVNIWDDYHDDGFIPDGETQETYAYIENDELTAECQRAVLLQLQQTIHSIKKTDSKLVCYMEYYNAELVYPNLVGTEHEICLYKRWQLQMRHLPHTEREAIVTILGQLKPEYNGTQIIVYSES